MYSNLFSPQSIAGADRRHADAVPQGDLGDLLCDAPFNGTCCCASAFRWACCLWRGRRAAFCRCLMALMSVLNVIINLLRSIPFLILMIMVFPLSRLIIGTTVGTTATIVPLVVAAFPFVARLVESSLREVDPNIIEAAQSMGATPMQIICKVMIPESVPSLLQNFTIALTTILGYSAMSGIIGGGGLGKIAIDYGYYRYKYLVMFAAVVLLIILVQIFQSVGTRLSAKSDKRLKK